MAVPRTPASIEKARQQGERLIAAAAAAAFAFGPHLIVGGTTGQVAGVGNLAPVTAATGTGAGLADASRTAPPS